MPKNQESQMKFLAVPLPAFGGFCPCIPCFSSTLLNCRNILSLLQRHTGLSNMRFALSIGHDRRRPQAEIINPPLAGLQEEGVRIWASHLMPSNDQMALSFSRYPSQAQGQGQTASPPTSAGEHPASTALKTLFSFSFPAQRSLWPSLPIPEAALPSAEMTFPSPLPCVPQEGLLLEGPSQPAFC